MRGRRTTTHAAKGGHARWGGLVVGLGLLVAAIVPLGGSAAGSERLLGVGGQLVLAAQPASTGAATPPKRTLSTGGSVTLLAADGPLAAAVVKGIGSRGCTQVVLWRPGSAAVVIDAKLGCADEDGFIGVTELALGGKRVIWQQTGGTADDFLEMVVGTATTSKPKETRVSYAVNGDGIPTDPGGDYTGNLVADGPLLVFASWRNCSLNSLSANPCTKGKLDPSARVLHGVVDGKDTVLRKSDGVLYPVWVDAGRILVKTPARKLTLFSTSGATLRSFDVGKNYRTAVFQGKQLVVLRPTALDVYDTDTGAKTTSFELSKKSSRELVDVQAGIAVLIADGAIRLIKLDTPNGAGATVKPPGGGTIKAQLEPTGLFYASNAGLGFLPMADVLTRFR